MTRIVIEISGGLVSTVLADSGAEVVVIDRDTDGVDDSSLVTIPGDRNEQPFRAFASIRDAERDPNRVSEVFATLGDCSPSHHPAKICQNHGMIHTSDTDCPICGAELIF